MLTSNKINFSNMQEFLRFRHPFLYTITFVSENLIVNMPYVSWVGFFFHSRWIIFPELYCPTNLVLIYFRKKIMASGVAVKTGKKKTRGKGNRNSDLVPICKQMILNIYKERQSFIKKSNKSVITS